MMRFFAWDEATGEQTHVNRLLSDIVPDLPEDEFEALYAKLERDGTARIEYDQQQLFIRTHKP